MGIFASCRLILATTVDAFLVVVLFSTHNWKCHTISSSSTCYSIQTKHIVFCEVLEAKKLPKYKGMFDIYFLEGGGSKR